MKIIKNFVKRIMDQLEPSAQKRRRAYHKKLAKKLKNDAPSIIASNCMGTFIYYTLGVKYYTPTINLIIKDEEFLLFCENIKGYLSVEMVEVKEHEESYPVGELEYNGEKIRVYFVHYDTFEDAKKKWHERKQRINYDNLYIVQMMDGKVTREHVERFDALPYKNKMLIMAHNDYRSKNVVVHKLFRKKKYQSGMIFWPKWRLSSKRYMDDIDYVGFLNRPSEPFPKKD